MANTGTGPHICTYSYFYAQKLFFSKFLIVPTHDLQGCRNPLLTFRDSDGTNSETDRDTLGPLPAPQTVWAGGNHQQQAPPPTYHFSQPPSLGVTAFGSGIMPQSVGGPIYTGIPKHIHLICH